MHGSTPTVRRRPRRAPAFVALCAAGLLTGACDAEPPEVSATEAYVPVPANPSIASAYVTLRNTGGDTELVSVSSPDAKAVQIHRTDIDDSGRATMRPVGRLALPAGRTVTFSPGGLHLMLIEPGHLTVGRHVELHLRFASSHARELVVSAPVVDEIPDGSS